MVLALIVAGGAALHVTTDEGPGESEGVTEVVPAGAAGKDRGLVRVVAGPWAEI